MDGSGNLYVADSINNRVLEYSSPFAACAGVFPCVAGPASLVLGQGGSFTSNIRNDGGVSGASLDYPEAVAADGSGNLYVADSGNSRVLEYNAPLSTGATAALVFGQGGSPTSNACNYDYIGKIPCSANDLCDPSGVAVDGAGNLYVADGGNNRVLEYNTPLNASSGESGAGDTTADMVFGQGGSFIENKCNGITADSLCAPSGGLAVDGLGNLYVADGVTYPGNLPSVNRVLEYDTPLSTGNTTADRVFGTCGSFTSTVCPRSGYFGVPPPTSPNTLNAPTGVAVDGSGNLYVVDNGDNRVLKYDQPLTTPTPTISATPTVSATPTTSATATASATATPTVTPTPVAVTLKIAPKSLEFPKTTIGTSSKSKTVEVSNPKGNKKHPGAASVDRNDIRRSGIYGDQRLSTDSGAWRDLFDRGDLYSERCR